jgi:hypothetical protein
VSQILIVVVKGLVGGAFVVVFSLLGEVIRPRGLAGITSAAPSVAIASLAVTLMVTGVSAATDLSLGMIAGAAALVVWCLIGIEAVKRLGALKGSVVTSIVWCVISLSLWAVFLR